MESGERPPDKEDIAPPPENPPGGQTADEPSPPQPLIPPTTKKKGKPEKDVPRSRIPLPTSVNVGLGGRTGFLDDLSEQVYQDNGVRRRRRRRLVGRGEGDNLGYGPPGILHEDRRLRRGSSSELGDSSIELLGPTGNLDTDESDGSEELLGEAGTIHLPAGSAMYPTKLPERKRKPYHVFSTSEDEVERREDRRRPSSKIGRREKKSVTWHRDDATEESRTPSRSISRSPVERAEKKVSILKTNMQPPTPPRRVATTSTAARQGEVRPPPSSSRWGGDERRVSTPHKTVKKLGGSKLPIHEDTSGQSSGGEGKVTPAPAAQAPAAPAPVAPANPRPGSASRSSVTPDKTADEGMTESEAGEKLLKFCKKCDWYGADGCLRFFERRVRSGKSSDPKPLADLKDEESGWTPLMYAIKESKISLCDRFIEMGCDVNAMTKDGLLPIHISALHGREETISFLIAKKADVTALTDKDKQSVIHLATTRTTGNTSTILRTFLNALPPEARLEPDGNKNIPIFQAILKGLRGSCQELLMQKAAEQLQLTSGRFGDTPLHLAIRKKNLEISKILTDAGAEVNAGNVSNFCKVLNFQKCFQY